jgi:serine/threonine-protein kinase
VGKAGWGTPIPVDPGEHKITANAPGAKPREITTAIPDKGQTITVALPPIEYLPIASSVTPAHANGAQPVAPAQASATPDDARPWFSAHQRAIGLVVGAVGVVGLGVGTAFGLMAKSTYDNSNAHCVANQCDATGHDFRQSAFGKATVSDVTFGVGAAGLIGGAVLFLTAPKRHSGEPSQPALLTPVVGPNLALISLQRSW